jgi:hypothetical protein
MLLIGGVTEGATNLTSTQIAGNRWASDGSVVPMMVVDVEPVGKSSVALTL